METTVITFDITSSFEDWANAYDKSLPAQKEFGLESLYRGHEKDNPTKCVVIVSASEGALDKFMEANAEMVAASGHVMESTVLTTYMS
jgi:hypothetical protein|tara:strand:- start:192 stop:455 length:264 start_codon:yes stop_codon:yes gene_type:complete